MPIAHLYQVDAGEIIGKYRGAEVRLRHLKTPIYQPSFCLTYRGVKYYSKGSLQTEATGEDEI